MSANARPDGCEPRQRCDGVVRGTGVMGNVASGGVVVFRRTGGVDDIDAIDEYSRRLVSALAVSGVEARYEPGGLGPVVAARESPAWVLLQYNPFRYGRWGFAPGLVRDVLRLRRRRRIPLAIMVHEAWFPMTDWRSTLIGLWQRAQLRLLLRLADGVMTSTEALAREVGHDAVHVPVATNITPAVLSSQEARDRLGLDGGLAVALFGRAHPSRALRDAEAAIARLAEAHGTQQLTILNLGADAPGLRVPSGVEVLSPGRLAADELSLHLLASDIVLLPFTDGVSTRRGTLMAALAHGRPVLGQRGRNTDAVLAENREALVLTPTGDPTTYSQRAVELTNDVSQLNAIGDAGQRLYESRFDWPVAARAVGSKIEAIRAGSSRVVFVANDVGGPGGMERQSEELVSRLLDAGHSVKVIARTCTLAGRDGLDFVRVRTPSRPFAVAYPAFFLVASLLATRRRGAMLHTTGAIIANRADVSTVHYCHHAAAAKVAGSRASRPSPLYRLNAALARIMSRAGEAWCYRPQRTRLLCGVSSGVGRELRSAFPSMRDAVRAIPNGVDSAAFRPDEASKRKVRAELGIDERAPLALFVGGDWERKGLSHAVDALAFAGGWQLAVAGPGDATPLISRARGAGTDSRLHFLGVVTNPQRLYTAADAFVLPTAYETFSLVTFEAAASGLPLLVTRVSGVDELLEDGGNGWFITRDAREIAGRLAMLRSDPGLARRMSEAARAAASCYSWDAMASGYMSLYEELATS